VTILAYSATLMPIYAVEELPKEFNLNFKPYRLGIMRAIRYKGIINSST